MYAAASQNIELKPFNVTLVTEETNATTLLAYSITATVLTVRINYLFKTDRFDFDVNCLITIPL